MRPIYIASTERASGKTTIAIALISQLVKKGLKVVPFKPFMFNFGGVRDETVEVLLQVSKCVENISDVCPIRVEGSSRYLEFLTKIKSEELLKTIKDRWNYLKSKYDIVVGVGYKSLTHKILGKVLELDIVKELNCKVLIVSKPTSEDNIGDILAGIELAKSRGIDILGVVFNCVRPWIKSIVDEWCRILASENVDVLGIVDEDLNLLNPSIRELVDELQGKVLVNEDKLDTTYEHVLVGAMTPDAALRYMRSTPNKIVITGGDRADIIMLALETDTRAIILTGGIMPSPRVIARAEERGVPIILVNYDTYTTVSKILQASGKVRIGDKRIDIIVDKVSKCINIDKILEKISE